MATLRERRIGLSAFLMDISEQIAHQRMAMADDDLACTILDEITGKLSDCGVITSMESRLKGARQ